MKRKTKKTPDRYVVGFPKHQHSAVYGKDDRWLYPMNLREAEATTKRFSIADPAIFKLVRVK